MLKRTAIMFLVALASLTGCHSQAIVQLRPDFSHVERLVPTNDELDESLNGDEMIYYVAAKAVGRYGWELKREEGTYTYSDCFEELATADGERSDTTVRTSTTFKNAPPYELLAAEQV